MQRPVIPRTPPMAAELLKNCQSLTVDYCQPCAPSHPRHRFGSLPGAISFLAVLSLLPGQVLAALSFSPALTLVRTVLPGPLEGFAIFGLLSKNNLAIVSGMLRGHETFSAVRWLWHSTREWRGSVNRFPLPFRNPAAALESGPHSSTGSADDLRRRVAPAFTTTAFGKIDIRRRCDRQPAKTR